MSGFPAPAVRPQVTESLEAAARVSMRAPSVFNTQPWHWRISGSCLELRADRTRQLDVVDPDGRLLILSCGAALHHARIALAADAWSVTVLRMPDRTDPDLLARIEVWESGQPDPAAQRLVAAVERRRTDRRAFSDRPVPEAVLTELRRAVESQGAGLHQVRRDQMPMLATSTDRAARIELDDPAYREELARWTNRPTASGDGVPPETAVRRGPRRVPVRNYTPGASTGLEPGDGFDLGASFVVLFGPTDDAASWLRGGEAMSALLLSATAGGLATAPLSDTIEVEWPRTLLRELLGGVGEPLLVVRLGYRDSAEEVPPAPRRDPVAVIEYDE